MAKIGHGTTYSIWDPRAGTPAYVALGEIISVQAPEISVDAIDTTHMGTSNKKRTFIAGLIDGGEATIEFFYDPANASDTLILAAIDNGDVENHQITFPDAETCTYKALITGYSRGVPLDDKMTGSITVKVSGAETWA